ncbi:hypothetical protein JOE09_001282 [Pantoea coffeiphila]|nr:hypothetical protein [Pantoea coffeiphila]
MRDFRKKVYEQVMNCVFLNICGDFMACARLNNYIKIIGLFVFQGFDLTVIPVWV